MSEWLFFYERGSSFPHHSSKQVVCDDLLWENIANLQHRFFSPPGLRQHAIDIKEKKKNAICRTGHWDRSKQKVMKRVIQEEGESSRWSKKPFFLKKNIFSWPPFPFTTLGPPPNTTLLERLALVLRRKFFNSRHFVLIGVFHQRVLYTHRTNDNKGITV